MAEYIERDNVYEVLRSLLNDIYADMEHSAEFARGFERALRCAADNVRDIAAADVRPERHGAWSDAFGSLPRHAPYGWRCSACGDVAFCMHLYCPNCGAKMDGSSKSNSWIATSEQLPPENQIVDTKIHDEKGVRNEQELIYSNNLWFLPDKSMYVYYIPTHWRYNSKIDEKGSVDND